MKTCVEDEKFTPIYQKLKSDIVKRIFMNDLRPGDKIPSVRELAKENGVSLAPVIKAVQELDEEGYIVRYHGKGSFVRSRKTDNSDIEIALVIPGIDCNEMFTKMAVQMQQLANVNNFKAIILSSETSEEIDLVNDLMNTTINAAIIYPPAFPEMAVALQNLKERDFPFALLNWNLPSVVTDRVTSNDTNALYLATKHLTDLGHQNIAFITDHQHYEHLDPRYVGYLKALLDAGLEVRRKNCFSYPRVIHNPGDLIQQGGMFAREIIAKRDITALVANNAMIAAGIAREFRNSNYRFPENFSIVSIGAGSFLSIDLHGATIVDIHEDQVIHKAVDVCLEKIKNPQLPFTHHLIKCSLIQGNTTAVLL